MAENSLCRRAALLAPRQRPQSRPISMDMDTPCVLPRERASRPGDERYSAKPPRTADFVLAVAKKDGHQGAGEKKLDRRG